MTRCPKSMTCTPCIGVGSSHAVPDRVGHRGQHRVGAQGLLGKWVNEEMEFLLSS